MNHKFNWLVSFAMALPISLVKTACHIPWLQMIPVIALCGVLVFVLHERKYGSKKD